MSGGPEYALRLREVEEENARLRADLQAIDFHLDEYGTGNDALAGKHKGSVRRAAIFCVQDLWAELTRERAESSRLSREVEEARAALRGVVRAAFWAMGWRRFVERHICLGGHPASRRFRRSRERLARVLSGGGDASATGEKR